jgi:hypothetical protein
MRDTGRDIVAVGTIAQQHLRIAAELAWDARGRCTWDMNGAMNGADTWLWLKWVFFAPGDLLLLLLIRFGKTRPYSFS